MKKNIKRFQLKIPKLQNRFCKTWTAWHSFYFPYSLLIWQIKRINFDFLLTLFSNWEMSYFFLYTECAVFDSWFSCKSYCEKHEVAVLRYSVFFLKRKTTKKRSKTFFLFLKKIRNQTTDEVLKGKASGHSFEPKALPMCRGGPMQPCVRTWPSSESCHEGLNARIERKKIFKHWAYSMYRNAKKKLMSLLNTLLQNVNNL